MDLLYTIATARRHEMERTAATERLAAQLRAERPRRTPLAGIALAALLARVRDTAAAPAEPCPTC